MQSMVLRDLSPPLAAMTGSGFNRPMCCRYHLSTSPVLIAELFGVATIAPAIRSWLPRYNIAPGQACVMVRGLSGVAPPPPGLRQRGGLSGPLASLPCEVATARWGLIPRWAADETIGVRTINAGIETADSTPSLRESFRTRRCVVPADGFYEWTTTGGRKTPLWIGVVSEQTGTPGPFAMAGIWDRWEGPAGAVETFSVLTCAPNSLMAEIHDRMPVILAREDYAAWMDPSNTDVAGLTRLCRAIAPERMVAHPVGALVNSPRHDSPRCLEPASQMDSPTLFG